jgi:uracil-DNA glycosylase
MNTLNASLYYQIPLIWREFFTSQGDVFLTRIQNVCRDIQENLTLCCDSNPSQNIYPPQHEYFQAFNLTTPNDVKVVILGQDPYHGFGQAHGLAFSVKNTGITNTKIPPSLRNIFKELIKEEMLSKLPLSGDLSSWAKQGVFLLNNTLTVSDGQPNSHLHIGWSMFTDLVIQSLQQQPFIIYCLWGNFAQKKTTLLKNPQHVILTAGHPSPLSVRYFSGCGHFSKINQLLQEKGLSNSDWNID